jgi:hypothetical protein
VKLSRRKFIAAASGLFIPSAPYVIIPGRAQLTVLDVGASGGVASCPSVTPGSLANRLLWFGADVNVTTSGGNVTQVTDQFGVLSPTYQILLPVGTVPWSATAFNGHNAFNFNSTGGNGGGLANTQGALTAGSVTTQFTVYAAISFVNGGQDNGSVFVYSSNDMFATAGSAWAIMNATATTQTMLECDIEPNGSAAFSPAMVSGNFYSVCVVFDGVHQTVYTNNVAGTPVACSQAIDNSVTAVLALGCAMLGGSPNNGFLNWNGPVAEVIFQKGIGTPTEICGINAFFKAKYGL